MTTKMCFVPHCSSSETARVTFHHFPRVGKRNFRRCQLWAQFCQPDVNWSNKEALLRLHTTHKYICNRHFRADAYSEVDPSKLNSFSIPTLNPLPIPSDNLLLPVSNSLPASHSAHNAPGTPTLSVNAHSSSSIQAINPGCISDQVEEISNPLQFLQKDSNNSGIENGNSTIKIAKIESVKECRLCMKAMTDAKNIFEEYIDVNVSIYLAVTVCLHPIKVSPRDPLSKYICGKCLNTLSSFVKFRNFVLRNDKIQRKYHDDNTLFISKNAAAEKRHIDTENEPQLIKKIKCRPEQVESFGISNQPNLPNKGEGEGNILKENGSTTQREAKSSIQLDHNISSAKSILHSTLDKEETDNKKQEEKSLPHISVPKENLNSKQEVSNGSQTTYDHNPFTLANGYLMEHKLLKGNLRYLKCALAQCPAVGTQEVLKPGIFKSTVSITTVHNHKMPTEIEIEKQKLISVIRKKLQRSGRSSIRSIYDEISKLDSDLSQIVAKGDLMKDICNL